MVTKGWAYEIMSRWYPVQIIKLVEKYKTHTFNKANTVIIGSFGILTVPWVK